MKKTIAVLATTVALALSTTPSARAATGTMSADEFAQIAKYSTLHHVSTLCDCVGDIRDGYTWRYPGGHWHEQLIYPSDLGSPNYYIIQYRQRDNGSWHVRIRWACTPNCTPVA